MRGVWAEVRGEEALGGPANLQLLSGSWLGALASDDRDCCTSR